MSGFVGNLSLTVKQQDCLEQFKGRLTDVLRPEHDDAFLLRWLRARKFNLDKSEKMLRDHLDFRIYHDCDKLTSEWERPKALQEYMIGGLFGEDREGHPVWYDPYGCLDTKGIFYSSTRYDFLRYKILACELTQEALLQLSGKHGRRIETTNVVFDLQHANFSHLWRPFTDRYSQVISAFEANYPERLRRGIVINAPKFFTVGFELIKPFLSEETKEKVIILGSNYKEKLREFIHPDYLPVHYGGNATDKSGDPRCASQICFGGQVPSTYYLTHTLREGCDKVFHACIVPPGKSEQVQFEVTEAGSALKWEFETENDNIGFGIFFQQNGMKTPKEVLPVVRCDCHMVPERGQITCKSIGNYIVKFDNTYSWIRSKEVFYFIEVSPPGTNQK